MRHIYEKMTNKCMSTLARKRIKMESYAHGYENWDKKMKNDEKYARWFHKLERVVDVP